MSYYRSPDDLPGPQAAGVADGVAGPSVEAGPATAGIPAPPATPIAEVVAGAEADAARRKRKQVIIGACVVVDVIIVAIVLALVLG